MLLCDDGDTHHFVLVVDADAILDQRLDDLQVALGRGPLKSGVPGLQ